MENEFCTKYLDLVNGEYAGINLTRINSYEDFYNKQYRDSIIPFEESKILEKIYKNTKIHIDVGFGGGFPLLPMAYHNPDKKYLGFEARGKKAKVVGEIAQKMGINNVKTYHQRYENVYLDQDCLVSFKAVSTVENLLPGIITDKTVHVLFYKGPNFYELEDLDWLGNQWEIVEEKLIDIPGTEGRMVIVLKNKTVLRGTMIRDFTRNKNKNIVSLSKLL
ncbi:16S rRNA (guanine(527)-N(7))-methyltransferase RsmG [Bacteriovorax sp. Seq25_V]|uniref:16S rRNA (guanine(527)-N(7))-methyltransferase RsmG n=1 Tax=Bacteriovorax sp. Seq25_V TaxID=1201288 RepID=UPI00038A2415|nr:RsmG family class I SAM-dependent methyltransferase [Bacteriovorax sp. Seq25_V]EQC43389.1 rRNA small subunit methyltransferase G [Bacteriovorax sp. Seq25_V]